MEEKAKAILFRSLQIKIHFLQANALGKFNIDIVQKEKKRFALKNNFW